jgi:hypothetical protein
VFASRSRQTIPCCAHLTVLSPHPGSWLRENFTVFYRQSIRNVLVFLDSRPIRLLGDEH